MSAQSDTPITFKFIWRNFVVATVLFVTVLVMGNVIVNVTCATVVEFDCPITWPISIFSIRIISPLDIGLAGVLLGILFVGARILQKRAYPLLPVLGLAVVLMLGSTAIAGWELGFIVPIDYDPGIYYHDVIRIEDPFALVQDYENLQQTFLYHHARTNPPGALLNLYALNQMVPDPGIISLIILVVSTVINGSFFYAIVKLVFPEAVGLAGYMTLLFLCIPAVQIYYTHGVDPILATLLLATIYFVLSPHRYAIIGAVICLFWASFTSFLSIFVLPILFGLFLHRTYRLRILMIGLSVIVLYIGIALILNYNYLNSFRIASSFENPEGFRLFSDTATYLSTRFESIGEILLFFTPFLLVFLLRGVPAFWRDQSILRTLSGFALIAFLGMMMVGVLSTGEAARALVFVYPYLLFPVIYAIRQLPQYRILLVCLVYGQTLLMQTIGIYFA